MTPDQSLALARLRTYDRWGDVFALAGPRRAKDRQSLMTLLTGRKVTQAQSGVNALRDALWTLAEVSADTIVGRERAFAAWLDIHHPID